MEVWTCSVLFKTVKSLQILHYYSFLSLGFCSQHHGPNANRKIAEPPSELMCVAEYMIPRIILRLIQHLRINSIPSNAQMDKEAQWYIFFSFQIQLFSQSIIRFFFKFKFRSKCEQVILKSDRFLKLLHDFSSLGSAMRTVMTKCLIDPVTYQVISRVICTLDFSRKTTNAVLSDLQIVDVIK